jgi:hypothetical protein
VRNGLRGHSRHANASLIIRDIFKTARTNPGGFFVRKGDKALGHPDPPRIVFFSTESGSRGNEACDQAI